MYKVAFRRRRSNLTNYAKRLALVKGSVPRMVVRKSSTGVSVQFMEFSQKGDRVVSQVRSGQLKAYSWAPRCNTPTAYLCGLLAGKLAGKKGVKEFNLDIGMYTPSKGSVVFAALRGAIDSGLLTNYSEEMITEDRIAGAPIAAFAKALRASDEAKYNRIFSSYIKQGFRPENMVEAFASAKSKLKTV